MKRYISGLKKSCAGFLAALSLAALSGCGEYATVEHSDEIPSMTEQKGFSYLETTEKRTPTQTTEGTKESLPDMTGTDLATTYIDEFGNTYGISETEPPVINSDNTLPYSVTDTVTDKLAQFPDIGIDEYYKNTDPVNTVSLNTASVTTTANTTISSATVSETTTPATVSETTVTTEPPKSTTLSLVESRRGTVPSRYTKHNEVMHTNSYNYLTDKQKYAYDAITATALDHEKSVKFELSDKITFDDMYAAYQTLYLDEVRLFYIDTEILYNLDYATQYITDLDISYLYTKDQVENMKKEIEKRADEILSKVTPDMTDYDIVKLIHDEIIKSCTYTLSGNTNNITSIYGTLAQNKAQCQGYARTFSYLCNLCGIETDIALGVANEDHMWNMVKIDGKWYHIDLTWDDPDKKDFPDFIRYDYFCVTTDRMLELRTIEGNSHTLPTADSEDLEYYNYNGLVVNSVEEARELYKREALEISKTRSSTVQFRCSTSEVYEEVLSEFFDNNAKQNVIFMTDVINDDPSLANRFDSNTIYHQGNYDTMIIKIFLNYEEGTADNSAA